jgi:hypothetical protein
MNAAVFCMWRDGRQPGKPPLLQYRGEKMARSGLKTAPIKVG